MELHHVENRTLCCVLVSSGTACHCGRCMTSAISEVTETFCLCTAGDKHVPVTRCVRNTDCTAHSSTAPSFHRAGTASPHSAEGPSPLRPLFPEQHSLIRAHSTPRGAQPLNIPGFPSDATTQGNDRTQTPLQNKQTPILNNGCLSACFSNTCGDR